MNVEMTKLAHNKNWGGGIPEFMDWGNEYWKSTVVAATSASMVVCNSASYVITAGPRSGHSRRDTAMSSCMSAEVVSCVGSVLRTSRS